MKRECLCQEGRSVGGIVLLLRNIVCNIPCYVLCFDTICKQFNVMIRMDTLQNCGTPIVEIAICPFWAPFARLVDPVIERQRKQSIYFAYR